MTLVLRELARTDEASLWEMLRLASHEEELAVVRGNPDLARYAGGWGRPGDFGWGIFEGEVCVGAAWCRVWRADDAGFGFVDEWTPELAVAVAEEWRGQGLGTRLIEAALELASGEYSAVSLSVRQGSSAERLYSRLGFEVLSGSERVNRVGGVSVVMVRRNDAVRN